MRVRSALALALPGFLIVACGDDETSTTAASTTTAGTTTAGTTTATTTAGTTTAGTGGSTTMGGSTGGGLPNGEVCDAHDECMSGYCLQFSDAPVDAMRACEDAPANMSMRFTGTIRDITDRAPVSGANMDVVGAIAPMDVLVNATSGGDGTFDATSDGMLTAAIAVVSNTTANGFFATSTGFAQAPFPAGNDVHDVWLVPDQTLTDYNAALAGDMAVAPFLPLGPMGGVVGIVRDATGAPIAGATLEPASGSTMAVIRYVEMDGMSFNETGTTDTGLFVLVNPALAEGFNVMMGGAMVAGPILAGSNPDIIFSMAAIVE